MADKPEWFKLNPSKFLQDSIVDQMTTLELGCCVRLLCRQWIDGSIPDDIDKLARICRIDGSGMGQAWVTLCQFFPELTLGQRANRFMFIERELVLKQMEDKSRKGLEAATKRWDDVRKTRDRSPMPDPLGDPMQDTDTDTEKKKNADPSGSKRKRRSKGEIIQGFSPDVRRVVNELGPIWPVEGKDGDKTSPTSPQDFCQRIAEILEGGNDPEVLIQAAKDYISIPKTKYAAPQFFFGKQGYGGKGEAPWVGFVKFILTKRELNANAAS